MGTSFGGQVDAQPAAVQAAEPVAANARAGRVRRQAAIRGLFLAGLAAALAGGVAVVALRAWRLDLGVPLRYSGDALLHLGYVQNMLDSGWYLEGPRLGAPYGQDHHDYPLGPDNAHFVLLRGLTMLTGQAPASVNLFYLLTFPLVALAALWALRRLRVPAPVALVGAVSYALLPYHFLRVTGHLFLAAYWSVPLGAYLIVATIEGRRLFRLGARRAGEGWPRRLATLALPVVLALLVVSGGAYYAVFTLALLVPATLIAWARVRRASVAVSGLAVSVLIVVFLGLNSLPTLQYRLQHGENPDVPVRDEIETERHALRPVTLVLPVQDHRFEPFAELADRYAAFPTPGERGESLGLVGAIGLVGLIALAVGGLTGAFGRGRRWIRQRRLSALVLIALLLGVTGGGSTLVALLVSPQIRAWSRISVFIAFFALLAVCILLGDAWRRSRRTRWRPLIALGLSGLLVVAALDQTSNRYIPGYGALAHQYSVDRDFVAGLESSLPAGAAVYQLPFRPYLEAGPLADAVDYDHMRGYLHSRGLRWSYGGMKGREAGWQPFVHGRQPSQALPVIAAAGFSAVWVDRRAYSDAGLAAEASLTARLGEPMAVSPDRRFAVYDIRPYAVALRAETGQAEWAMLEEAILSPVWLRWRGGVERGFVDAARVSRGAGEQAILGLVNDGPAQRDVVISFSLSTAHGAASHIVIRWPDGTVETVTTTAQPTTFERTIVVGGGENRVEFVASGPEMAEFGGREEIRMRIADLWVLDPELLALTDGADR